MDIISRIRNYLKSHSLRRIWYRVALILSSMAVFVTTYFLMLPALTVTGSTSITKLGTNGITQGITYGTDGKLKINVNNIFRIDAYLGPNSASDRTHSGIIYDYLKPGSSINTVLVRLKSTNSSVEDVGNFGDFFSADRHNNKGTYGGGMNQTAYEWYLNNAGGSGTSVNKTAKDTSKEGNIDFSQWVVVRVECFSVRQKEYTTNAANYEFYAVQQVYGTVDRVATTHANYNKYKNDATAKLNVGTTTDKGFLLLIRKSFINTPSSLYNSKVNKMYIPKAGYNDDKTAGNSRYVDGKDFYDNKYQFGLDDLVDFNQEPLVRLIDNRTVEWNGENLKQGIYSTGSTGYCSLQHGTGQHGLGFITFSNGTDQRNYSNAGEQAGDIETIDDIDFKLFNYNQWINSTVNNNRVTNSAGVGNIRKIAPFFNFRYTDEYVYDEGINNYNPHAFYWNDLGACACMSGNGTSGTCYLGYGANTTGKTSYLHRAWPLANNKDIFKPFDTDSFDVTHTTVEYNLLNGFPVLDFTRNAKFQTITHTISSTYQGLFFPDDSVFGKKASENYGFDKAERSLEYLFSSGDGQVTAHDPINTILQYDEITGRYYYDSSKNAVDYDGTSNKKMFRLRNYVESGESGAFSGTQTFDFFPFNYCSGIVAGTEYVEDSSGKYVLRQKHFNDCYLMASLGDNVTVNNSVSNFRYHNIDYWFGMTMEFNFTQNKDGKLVIKNEKGEVVNTKDMIFNFAGDDDVWVFIDDALALDLGGTHSIVNGSINFATGQISQAFGTQASKTYTTTLYDCFERAGKVTKPDDGSAPDGWKKVTYGNGKTSYIFEDYSIHNLKFFYLERGGHVANNKIEFYMSTFPNNSLLVEKQVTPKDDPDLETIKETQEYKFRVLYTDSNGALQTDANGNYISLFEENYRFIIRDYAEDGTELDLEGVVGEDGIFTLKDGQTAIFKNMNAFIQDESSAVAHYVVQELLPDGQVFQYDGVAVNEVSVEPNTSTSGDNKVYSTSHLTTADTNHVRFTNKINKEKLHNLEIIKNLAAYDGDYGEGITADTEFPFEVIFNDGDGLPVGSQYYVYDLDAKGNVVENSEQIKTVEILTETVDDEIISRVVIKIKDKQKAVIKGILDGTSFAVQEIFDAETSRYTTTYASNTSSNFDGTNTVDASGVVGTMSSSDSDPASVTITVTNARNGVQTSFRVRKRYLYSSTIANAPLLSFKMYFYEVGEPKPNAERIPEADRKNDTTRTIKYSAIPASSSAEYKYGSYIYLYYPDIYEPGDVEYHYYKIYEYLPTDRPKDIVTYDTSVFILTVKVEKSLDGELTAEKVSIVKYKSSSDTSEGNQQTSTLERVTFTNTLKRIILPTTGANLFLNTRAFSLLGTAMVVSLLVVVLVCVRKRKNGVF